MGMLQLGVPVIAILALAGVLLSGQWRARQIGVSESALPALARVTSRIRVRNVVALLAAIVVGGSLGYYGLSVGADLGRSLLVAPLVTAAIGIGFFVIIPAFPEAGVVRSAELERRTVLSFASSFAVAIAGGLAASLAIVVVVWGIVAEPDGRSIGNDYGTLEYRFAASPFPGFFYGVPTLLALVILVAVALVALRRVTAARAPSDRGLREADATIRRLAVGVILRVASSGVALTFAFALIIAAQSSGSVNGEIMEEGVGGPHLVPDVALQFFTWTEVIAAFVLVIVGIVFAVSAAAAAVRRPLEPTLIEGTA